MSTKSAHLSYTHQNCVKVQVFCQTDGQGITMKVLQTEFHDNKSVDRVR